MGAPLARIFGLRLETVHLEKFDNPMSSIDKSSTSKVLHVFEGHPSFYCSNCSAVIASISHLRPGPHLKRYPPFYLCPHLDLHLGFEGRAYQQIILWARWARIVRSQVCCMTPSLGRLTTLSLNSLMHSAVNVRLGSKEDRPLL